MGKETTPFSGARLAFSRRIDLGGGEAGIEVAYEIVGRGTRLLTDLGQGAVCLTIGSPQRSASSPLRVFGKKRESIRSRQEDQAGGG